MQQLQNTLLLVLFLCSSIIHPLAVLNTPERAISNQYYEGQSPSTPATNWNPWVIGGNQSQPPSSTAPPPPPPLRETPPPTQQGQNQTMNYTQPGSSINYTQPVSTPKQQWTGFPYAAGYKKAIVLITNGTDEIEAVTAVSILRQGNVSTLLTGVTTRSDQNVTTMALKQRLIKIQQMESTTNFSQVIAGEHCIRIQPDYLVPENQNTLPEYDALIIPGGRPGGHALAESTKVQQWVKQALQGNKLVAATGTGVEVLNKTLQHGVGGDGGERRKEVTTVPWCKYLFPSNQYKVSDDRRVVRDGNLITSQGPGTSMEFALSVVQALSTLPEKKAIESVKVMAKELSMYTGPATCGSNK